MAAAAAIHLTGGLVVIMRLGRNPTAGWRYPTLHAFGLLVALFAAVLLLHLMQVTLWATLYWWRIGWGMNAV